MLFRHLRVTLFLMTAVACIAFDYSGTKAQAQNVLYSQPPGSNATLLQSSWWAPNDSDYDQYVWDGFVLSASGAVSEIRWRGGYDPARFGSGGPVVDFSVAIYASIPGGSQPDLISPPIVDYQTGGNAGQTLAGTFGGTAMYDYAFILPTPFQAAAGTKYWVQIEASQHGIPDWGITAGTGGDGTYFRRIADGGNTLYHTIQGDAAFTLLSTSNTVFPDSVDVGGGWKWSPWFGYYSDANPSWTGIQGWIYHLEHGWLYVLGNAGNGVYLWGQSTAWWWTSSTVYPNVYSYQEQSWLWYQLGSQTPRWFYNLTLGIWESF
jgi:hypothetical protein